MSDLSKVSGGAGMPPFETGTLRGVIRYLDKAGVAHILETSNNLKDLETVKSQLTVLRKALEAKGYKIEKEDIVDMLEEVSGGLSASLKTFWCGVASNAKDIRGILKYIDDNGVVSSYTSPVSSSREDAISDLTAFIKKNGLKKWVSSLTTDGSLEDLYETKEGMDILKDTVLK